MRQIWPVPPVLSRGGHRDRGGAVEWDRGARDFQQRTTDVRNVASHVAKGQNGISRGNTNLALSI
jgi:hypothetical protein